MTKFSLYRRYGRMKTNALLTTLTGFLCLATICALLETGSTRLEVKRKIGTIGGCVVALGGIGALLGSGLDICGLERRVRLSLLAKKYYTKERT